MRKKKAYLATVLALVLLLTAAQSSHAQEEFSGKWCSEQLDVGESRFTKSFINKGGQEIAGFRIEVESVDGGTCEAKISSVWVSSNQVIEGKEGEEKKGCGDWDLSEKDDWSNGDNGEKDNDNTADNPSSIVWVDCNGKGNDGGSEQSWGREIGTDKDFTIEIELKEAIKEGQKCRICIKAFNAGRFIFLTYLDIPQIDFYVADTGDPNVYIVVGCGAAAMDVVSATMLAAEISTMTYTDDSGSVTFDEPSSTEEDEEQTTGPDQIAPVDVDETSMIMLDTELDFAGWKATCDHNLILVGGPVANIIVKQLVDEGLSAVDWATSPGECEYIREPYGGCDILIVAGEDRDATRSAAQELLDSL